MREAEEEKLKDEAAKFAWTAGAGRTLYKKNKNTLQILAAFFLPFEVVQVLLVGDLRWKRFRYGVAALLICFFLNMPFSSKDTAACSKETGSDCLSKKMGVYG